MYQIYRYTAPDGRVYIGCTVRSLRKRSGEHGEGYKDATNFWQAIQEFGWDSFQVDVLATTEDADEATRLEDYYIQKYRSLDIRYGFNSIKSGGAKTESARKKQSNTMKKILNDPNSYFRSEERYQKQSAAIKSALSKPETREKMSKAGKRAWENPDAVFNTQEYRDRIADTMRSHWADPNSVFNSDEYREKQRAGAKELASRPEVRQKQSDTMKEIWKDPEYRQHQTKALKEAANREEVRQKRIEGVKAFNAQPGQYEIRCARQLIIQNDPEVKRKKREARLGKLWVHKVMQAAIIRQIVTDNEIDSYLASGWKPGMGPRSIKEE